MIKENIQQSSSDKELLNIKRVKIEISKTKNVEKKIQKLEYNLKMLQRRLSLRENSI